MNVLVHTGPARTRPLFVQSLSSPVLLAIRNIRMSSIARRTWLRVTKGIMGLAVLLLLLLVAPLPLLVHPVPTAISPAPIVVFSSCCLEVSV